MYSVLELSTIKNLLFVLKQNDALICAQRLMQPLSMISIQSFIQVNLMLSYTLLWL